jgi:type I restriction enzyme, S subunit
VSQWKETTLGETTDLLTGFPFKSANYTDNENGIALVRGDNVVQGRFRWDDVKRWPKDKTADISDYFLKTGDVILAMDRPWIDAGLKYACVAGEDLPCLLVQRVTRLRARNGLDQGFLRYVIGSREFTEYVLAVQTGTAVPHISGGQIKQFRFLCPPSSEQRAIASVLGALDDKVELNRRMNETLEALAQSLFKSWFVDATQPALPKGWRETVLSECCEYIFSGGTPSTQAADYWGGDIPWLSSGETRSRFIIDTEKTITPLGVENSSTRPARAGSTVIASAGQGHTRGQTSFLTFDSYINQSVVVLVADKKTSSDLFLFFDLARRYEQFRAMSDSQSSRGSLTTKLLAEMKVVVPPHELISKFDETVAPMTKKIIANLHESRTLAALRDALLPKLLSGEIRLDRTNTTG